MPWESGSAPVMMDMWDGKVSGTAQRAAVNRIPRAARPSIAGVRPRPTRSALRVSIVTRTMFGGADTSPDLGVQAAGQKESATSSRSDRRGDIFRNGTYTIPCRFANHRLRDHRATRGELVTAVQANGAGVDQPQDVVAPAPLPLCIPCR